MDLSSLFAGVDNLFKFLFIGGLVMLLTSMFYPLQKQQELDIEINSYNKEIKLLNRDLDDLKQEVDKLNVSSKPIELKLEGLSRAKRHSTWSKTLALNSQIKDIKSAFKANYDSLYKKKQTTEIKQIILEFNKSKIEILKKYSNTYDSYTSELQFWGIVFMVIGLLGWSISTVNVERLKIKELNKP